MAEPLFNLSQINETLHGLAEHSAHVDANIDSAFLLIMAIIVFFMHTGFAFLEAGSVRAKNTTNILLKNLIEACIGGLSYWLVGWAFAYGVPSNPFIGYGQFATPPTGLYAKWFFQFVFAAATSSIVSGAVAERCKFLAFLIYSSALCGFIYPVITHWAWAEGGWLKTLGFEDFAGSGVIHVTGGTFALVGSFLIGPRAGRFDGKNINKIPGHSVILVSLGGYILMFGFFAFNGGSQGHITEHGDGEAVARAMFNTIVSGACAGLISLSIAKFVNDKWSLLITINGTLTGMVSICAGCNVFYHWGAAAIGFGSGIMYTLVAALVLKLRIDDPLDAVGVHLGGGLWGILMKPLFDYKTGVWMSGFSRDSGLTVVWNLIGTVSIMAWSAVWGFIVFGLLKCVGQLRVRDEVEGRGLDIHMHGEDVYPVAAYGHDWGEDWDHEENKNISKIRRRSKQSLTNGLFIRSSGSPPQISPVSDTTIVNGDYIAPCAEGQSHTAWPDNAYYTDRSH